MCICKHREITDIEEQYADIILATGEIDLTCWPNSAASLRSMALVFSFSAFNLVSALLAALE